MSPNTTSDASCHGGDATRGGPDVGHTETDQPTFAFGIQIDHRSDLPETTQKPSERLYRPEMPQSYEPADAAYGGFCPNGCVETCLCLSDGEESDEGPCGSQVRSQGSETAKDAPSYHPASNLCRTCDVSDDGRHVFIAD